MKKRILSLILAIAMCFSVLATTVVAETELMGSAMGDMIRLYTDRIWSWQEAQFDVMTDEQKAVLENGYENFDANGDAFKALAKATVEEILNAEGTDKGVFLGTDTMMDLYKWKMMRDIMEGNADVQVAHDDYQDWLDRFTAFETANDEAISPSRPTAALNGLGDYSADLTTYYVEVASMYLVDRVEVTGEDADKFKAYADAFNAQENGVGEVPADYMTYLEADVVELIADGMYEGFELAMQVLCGEKVRGDAIFDAISDRSFKAAFLLVGEDFVKFAMDEVPTYRDAVRELNKRGIVNKIAMNQGLELMNSNNTVSVDTMYAVGAAVSEYLEEQDFGQEMFARINGLGFGENGSVAYGRDILLNALKSAMELVDDEHGVELVSFNTYLGRAFLTPKKGAEFLVEAGDDDYVINLSFHHNRYGFINEEIEKYDLEEFDVAVVEGSGIEAAKGDRYGEIVVNAAAAQPGDEVTIAVYRGFSDMNDADDEGVLRYVTEYTIKATGEVEDPSVILEEIDDVELGDTFTVIGTTNLDYVTVSVVKDGQTVYAVVYTKAEFEAGIELELPDNSEEGDSYTVVVGTEKASDSDDFTVLGAEDEYEVVLTDVADVTLDEKVTIQGTTNLGYVTVAIVKGGQTVYAVVYTKAEFEAGIELDVPDNSEVGDVYTVVVGTEKASDSDDFTILSDEVTYEVVLTDVEEVKLGETFTVIGTTNLPHVTVSVVKDGQTKYAVVYTKAEFEAGITLELPDGAAVGDSYTVVVGTERASDEYTFVVVSDEGPTDGPTDEPTEAIGGRLSLTGGITRTAKVGESITITVTPQNVTPEGATVEVRWTFEDGTIVNITNVAVNDTNGASTATVEKLLKGATKVTATLYVNGEAVDSKTVTVKDKTYGGGGGTAATSITVDVDEDKVIKTVTDAAVKAEFTPTSGEGAVEVKVEDGKLVVTGVTAGKVSGKVVLYNNSGNVISTTYYEFIVKDGETVIAHTCEWPDIAATATKDAHWAHQTIDTMTINGYIKGYDDGTFKPDQNITRAEFSAIVYRILGLEVAEDGVLYDDTVGHWAEDIIATMSLPEGYGMLRGYGDGTFGPNDFITREQAVAIIARAKTSVWTEATEGAKDVFTDAEDISWWFDGEMDAAVTNGLITGYEDGSYKPLNFTTRAEACVLLARAWPEVLE